MPDAIIWTFFGYLTPAGEAHVQAWFSGLDDDQKDAIRDTVGYLQHVPVGQWRKPHFYPLNGGLFEVRCKANESNWTIRIYGFFWPAGARWVFTFLLGTHKKQRNPQGHIAESRKRKSRVERGEANVEEFKFS